MPKRSRKPRKERKHRGAAALNSAAKALAYEWITAKQAHEHILQGMKENSQILVNISLEDFLLHARNIRDFFSWSNNNNDVIAYDYLGKNIRVKMPYLRKHRKRLNRKIAHLSYSRPYMSSAWNHGIIMKEIDSSMRKFIKRLKLINKPLAKKMTGLTTDAIR